MIETRDPADEVCCANCGCPLDLASVAVSLTDRDVCGWIVVDKTNRALDWDGELHPTEEAAHASLDGDRRFNNSGWEPFENYEILPVLAALSTQPAAGEVEWGVRFRSGMECRVSSENNARFEAEGIGVVINRTVGPWIEVQS